MKEVRYFYDPDLSGSLPEEEAKHVVRVLRMKEGDIINLMDGRGSFHEAEITTASNHRCLYRILSSCEQTRPWAGKIHLAVAPTKLNDRIEWLAEKATEIGWDRVSFLNCQFSERRNIKTERIEKILVSATKQSHKAWIPQVDEMLSFKDFVKEFGNSSGNDDTDRFICHCYEGEKLHLKDVVKKGRNCIVMIGPEGDFSVEEVALAEQYGFKPVTLGTSRLRTETAALVAVHLMQLEQA
ncbi:MAG: 16S rRNA (uracil(1498)-N(3))-methyltransferase [Bacteroidaceae bacterium]|nr:16S rRNA (uracil(1498)-N(3))-methyltransferase [Bacteroidaceae bacterium]